MRLVTLLALIVFWSPASTLGRVGHLPRESSFGVELCMLASQAEVSYDAIEDEAPWLALHRCDYLWIACIVAANLLFIARKIILAIHGCGLSCFDLGYDRRRLQAIAQKQSLSYRRRLYHLINTSYRTAWIVGLTLFGVMRLLSLAAE